MNDIKAFVFDMDGILLDTETICDRTWDASAKEMDLPKIAEAKNLCRGCSKQDTVNILHKLWGNDFPVDAFISRTAELFQEIEYSEGIGLMRGAESTLRFLKAKGFRLALASSTREITVRRQLKNAKIIDFFETITTGDMVAHSKPNPEIYEKAVASLNLFPADCVAVEDSPNGIKSAFSAGLKTIMIPDKIPYTKDLSSSVWKLLQSLDDIPKLLENLL